MKRPLTLVAFASLFFVAPSARADGAFCGDTLVSVGASSNEVAAACGSPTRTGEHTGSALVKPTSGNWHRWITVRVTEWYYDKGVGEGTLPRVFFFQEGVLTEVHTLSASRL